MGSIQITQKTTTTLTVRQETLVQQTVPDPAPEPQHQLAKDIIQVKPAQPDGPVGVTKKIIGGGLIGGSAMATISAAVNSMAAEAMHAPTVPAILVGAGMGTGIGLLNIETGDKDLNAIKNTAAGVLMGGAGASALVALGRSMGNEALISANMSSVGVGAAMGAGIALANNDFKDETANAAKNVAAGALIGGSGLSTGMALIRTMATERATSAGLTSAAVGTAFGAGIVLANMEASTKGGKLAKNLTAGALIGGSVGAAGSAVIRAMATETFRNPSLIGVGVGIAAGVGIALLNAED